MSISFATSGLPLPSASKAASDFTPDIQGFPIVQPLGVASDFVYYTTSQNKLCVCYDDGYSFAFLNRTFLQNDDKNVILTSNNYLVIPDYNAQRTEHTISIFDCTARSLIYTGLVRQGLACSINVAYNSFLNRVVTYFYSATLSTTPSNTVFLQELDIATLTVTVDYSLSGQTYSPTLFDFDPANGNLARSWSNEIYIVNQGLLPTFPYFNTSFASPTKIFTYATTSPSSGFSFIPGANKIISRNTTSTILDIIDIATSTSVAGLVISVQASGSPGILFYTDSTTGLTWYKYNSSRPFNNATTTFLSNGYSLCTTQPVRYFALGPGTKKAALDSGFKLLDKTVGCRTLYEPIQNNLLASAKAQQLDTAYVQPELYTGIALSQQPLVAKEAYFGDYGVLGATIYYRELAYATLNQIRSIVYSPGNDSLFILRNNNIATLNYANNILSANSTVAFNLLNETVYDSYIHNGIVYFLTSIGLISLDTNNIFGTAGFYSYTPSRPTRVKMLPNSADNLLYMFDADKPSKLFIVRDNINTWDYTDTANEPNEYITIPASSGIIGDFDAAFISATDIAFAFAGTMRVLFNYSIYRNSLVTTSTNTINFQQNGFKVFNGYIAHTRFAELFVYSPNDNEMQRISDYKLHPINGLPMSPLNTAISASAIWHSQANKLRLSNNQVIYEFDTIGRLAPVFPSPSLTGKHIWQILLSESYVDFDITCIPPEYEFELLHENSIANTNNNFQFDSAKQQLNDRIFEYDINYEVDEQIVTYFLNALYLQSKYINSPTERFVIQFLDNIQLNQGSVVLQSVNYSWLHKDMYTLNLNFYLFIGGV
jgi:hypothetical protein